MLIIHGDNLVDSRQFLLAQIHQAREKGKEIIRLEGKKLTLESLQQALEGLSLLNKENLVILENFFQYATFPCLNYLIKTQPSNLIIWEESVSPQRLKKLKAQEKYFKLPPVIFRFLDAILPHNRRNALRLLKQAINQTSVETVFYQLARQIRYLIIANQLGKSSLSDLHPFQQSKIAVQAKKFELGQLLTLHRKLLYIDWQQKTGQAAMDLGGQLDLFLASL
jgi:hypothetical protein